jgi:tripartite-type tricarboxylate transporter receptor subunit TctC
MSVRTRSILTAVAGMLLGMSGAAASDAYPSKPVTLVITGTAGGPPDIVGRWLADKLSPRLGQPIVVVNRPGAGGNLAMRTVAASTPDGYTLVIAGQGPFALNPHMYDNIGFDPLTDFAPITQIEGGPLILAAHPDVPVRSVADLIKLARQRPGKLNYGSPGTGTPPHMASELFRQAADIDVVRIPYPGPPAAMVDLMGGRLTYTFGAMNFQMPQVKAGKIKAIGISSLRRSDAAPDIPTIAESGLPGFEYSGWLGIAPRKARRETSLHVFTRKSPMYSRSRKLAPISRHKAAKHSRRAQTSSPNIFWLNTPSGVRSSGEPASKPSDHR